MEEKRAYDHLELEPKWQKNWNDIKLYQTPDSIPGRENYYTLVEFSYPSGNLHVGHWYAFAVPDIFARYKRMKGFNVLYPTGFDAFGLPAENAAIKEGADPKTWTYDRMEKMRVQLRSMGASFDWSREVVTCDPEYYKWTQWMFTEFLNNDLAYRAVTKVNWCPKDQTILANEQVVDGTCERCGTAVIQRDQEQWMLRITKYADRLIEDLDTIAWPHAIKEAQKNWIGRSEGSEIEFSVKNSNEKVKVFTTRADTLFGVTYVVLAPEHALISKLKSQISNLADVEKYISDTKKKSELDRQQSKEKTGVKLEGVTVINPANSEEVPLWIADYVLAGYGTGAVMAVPAHDERDFEFAKKYNLPIRQVVMPCFGKQRENEVYRRGVNCVVFNTKTQKYGIASWDHGQKTFFGGGIDDGEDDKSAATRELEEETGLTNVVNQIDLGIAHVHFVNVAKKLNRVADITNFLFILADDSAKESQKQSHETFITTWHDPEMLLKEWENDLKDLGQEHSIYFLKQAVTMAVGLGLDTTHIDFPKVKLNTDDGVLIYSEQFSNLASEEARKKITEFVGGKIVKTYRLRDWGISRQRYWGVPIPIVYDPEGKAHPIPKEHLPWLLPTDVDHTPDGTAPLARSKELLERTEKIFGAGWKPEVETMDTFVDSSWYFYRYLDNKNSNEFASKASRDSWMPIDLYMGGAEHTTMHLLYSRFWVKAMHDLGIVPEIESYTMRRNRGIILGPDGNKMSKSKGNVINPDDLVARLGADTVRLYLGFMGPYGVTDNYPWDPNGVVGVRRFLERVWRLQEKVSTTGQTTDDSLIHKAIKKIGEDIDEYKFNTAIAQMMIVLNAWEKENTINQSEYKTLLQLLSPFAPHITEELWSVLGEKESIHKSLWPTYDPSKLVSNTVNIAVQVNGKVRAELSVSVDLSEDDIKKEAQNHKNVIPWIEKGEIKRIIYVKGRLVNIVV